MQLKKWIWCCVGGGTIAALLQLQPGAGWAAVPEKPVYENNFEKAYLGKLKEEEFLVLDGAFEVRAEASNKFLELPGAPLETFGVLF